jgi:hypothetical protein
VTRNKPLIFKLGVASLSLFAAVLVYSFTRIYPPELLASIQAIHPGLAAQTGIFGSAPSFFYTLGLGLFIGACASNRSTAKLHCSLWIGLSLCLELTQHTAFAGSLSNWFPSVLPESIWGLIGPYWTRGVFDPIDLIATLIGGLIALLLITHLPMEENNAGS